jgi:hypothetical protein
VIRTPEGINPRILDAVGKLLRAAQLSPAALVDTNLDSGRATFFRREVFPVCAPAARRAAGDALRAHCASVGPAGLADAATVGAKALLESCAAQILAGELGPNEPDTDRAKARRGQPPTRGVATGALVQALRTARPYEP